MEYDSDENFLEFIGPDQDDANHSMEDDEALLDEGDDEDDDGEDDEDDGEGGEGEEDDGEGGEDAGGEYEDSREELAAGGEEIVAGADGENSAAAAGDGQEAAAAAALNLTAVSADMTADPVVGNVEVGADVGGGTGMEGGHGEQDGGVVPGIEVGERRDGEEAGLSDGDFEEDDLLLEEDGEEELDSRLKPDHRFFAVRALLEGGKTARKLNRRLKVQAGKDDGFLVKGDERLATRV